MPEERLKPWRDMVPEDVWTELCRARASEERLANVLEAHNNRLTTSYSSDPGYHEIILSNHERREMQEALRFAGGNP